MDLNDNICKICLKEIGKYTCPRCEENYCSLTCYRSDQHLECSETFYKECILSELKNENKSNCESKEKMLEILQQMNDNRTEQIDSDDDENVEELNVRLNGIDLNDAESLWNVLTNDERQEYEGLIKSDRIYEFVSIWTPWWEFKSNPIEEIGNDDVKKQDFKSLCPKILANIKPFHELSKMKPSECVKYNLLNIIGAYTCVERYFNGNCSEFETETVYLLTQLSKNLQFNSNFESFNLALESVYQQALINEWMVTDPETKDRLYKDINMIIQGPSLENRTYYLKSILSDIYRLMKTSNKCRKIIDGSGKEFGRKFQDIKLPDEKTITEQTLNTYRKKIKYLLSYLDAYGICLY